MLDKNHVFIIAEIGSNHNQDINRAFELMDMAKDAGADAVKFQSLQLDNLINKKDITQKDRRLFQKIKLDEDWYFPLFEHAKKIGIECISAPTYLKAVSLLKECGANYMKIASPQTYGYPALIKEIALSGIPTIMSTGYCNDEEINRAVSLFLKYGDKENLVLLHCISQYPTEYKNVNLQFMHKLKERYQVSVGFSDHTLGNTAAYAAVTMGAAIIEKHITLSRQDTGPDHFFASEPQDFSNMVREIRNLEIMLGYGEKQLTDFEKEFKETIVMYPHAVRDMMEGEIIRESDLCYFRSRNKEGVSPWEVKKMLIGQSLTRNVRKNEIFLQCAEYK